nr:DUF1292 domain-containing protein [bacterium]
MDNQHDDMLEQQEETSAIELVDEQGNTLCMQVLASFEHDGELYCALVPQDAMEQDEDGETDVVFLQITGNPETGEDMLTAVEDEPLL